MNVSSQKQTLWRMIFLLICGALPFVGLLVALPWLIG